MAQLTRPVEPFGEVNVYRKPDGTLEIVATILMVPDVEGARTGLALDGSSSMRKMYGITGIQSGAFARDWVLENRAGQVGFKALRARHAAHRSEEVGRRLRGMMPWITAKPLVDAQKN